MISTLRRIGVRSSRGLVVHRSHADVNASVSRVARALPSAHLASRPCGATRPISRTTFMSDDANVVDEIFYPATSAAIQEPAPRFQAKAVVDGDIVDVHTDDYRGKWLVLLFYPKDWTFVCPTEIIAFSDRHSEFEALGAQVLAISTDTEDSHLAWTRHPRKRGGLGYMRIPLVADTKKVISANYGVLLESEGIALRGLFIINPEGVLEQITINNLGIGRSVDETIRLIQAHQFLAEHGEVCPAGWKPGDKTMKPGLDASQEYFASVATEGEDDPLKAGEKVVVVESVKDFKEVIKKPKVVVDFVAPHCGKCRQMMPYVNQLSEEFGDTTFAKFDTSEEALAELSADLGVEALPSFRFFKAGQEVLDAVTGYKKKLLRSSIEDLQKKS